MQNVLQSEMGFPINLWTHHHQSFYRQQLNAAARYHQPDTTRYHQPEGPRYSTQMQQPGVTNQRQQGALEQPPGDISCYQLCQGTEYPRTSTERDRSIIPFHFPPKLTLFSRVGGSDKDQGSPELEHLLLPPPRYCHKTQNLRPHVDMLTNSKADLSLEYESVCLGS